MRPARLIFAIAISAALSAGSLHAAEAQVDPLAIPLVVLEVDAAVPTEAVEAVMAGIAAPVLRGDALRRGLSLAGSVEFSAGAAFVTRAEAATDLFFAGDHEGARAGFEGLLAGLEGAPAHLARDPGLRTLAFDARMFLAAIARLRGDEGLVDRLLAGARGRYPELEPGSAFPPWLRERYPRAVPEDDGTEDVILEVPAGCDLLVDGRESPPDAGRRVRLRGERHAVEVRCHGRPGPLAVVRRGASPAGFLPPAFRVTRLAGEDGEVVLAADPGAGEGALVSDLLELARAGGFERMVVVVGGSGGLALWLVDTGTAGLARVAHTTPRGRRGGDDGPPSIDPAALERAGAELAGAGGSPLAAGTDGSRPWYRDGAAWAVAATGVAAVVTGFAIGQAYGGPSPQEPAAVALMASGAVLTATGAALFLVPAPREDGGVAVTAGAVISF